MVPPPVFPVGAVTVTWSVTSRATVFPSALSNRVTLTVLTAIFLPLNLVTGLFGMNFEGLPLIHSPTGFWVAFSIMLALGVGMSVFFWRKRYLGRH